MFVIASPLRSRIKCITPPRSPYASSSLNNLMFMIDISLYIDNNITCLVRMSYYNIFMKKNMKYSL